MKDEYIIINKTAIENRIAELESKIVPNPNFDSEIDSYNLLFMTKQNELNKILSQSIPLIPEIEKAFDAGDRYRYWENNDSRNIPSHIIDKEDYISNLKLDI